MKDYHKIRILQGLLLIFSIWGFMSFDLQYTILGILVYCFLETIGGNIGLHRYFCHKQFTTKKIYHHLLMFFSHYIAVGSVLSWVGQHRWHHDNADTKKDQHSPYFKSLINIFFGVWEMNIPRKYVKDVVKDKTLLLWHRNYFMFHYIIIVILAIMGFEYLYFLYALPCIMCLISGYVLATVTHYHGYRTYNTNDHSTNSWIANIYTLGEGWHNNHHAFPTRIRQGEKKGEWDLPAYIIERFLDVNTAK